jgi:hypothetical protein
MNRKIIYIVLGFLSGLLWLSACTTSNITLEIKGNECTLESPTSLPSGKFTVKLIIEEEKPSTTGYLIAMLEGGKTINDIKALPIADIPDWINILIDEPYDLASSVTATKTFNLNDLMEYHGEPIYFVCVRANPESGILEKIGVYGPIEVKK